MKNHWIGCVAIAMISLTICSCKKNSQVENLSWRQVLKQELPRMGHRNFIVIADSAYPLQSAPGIKTIYTGQKQLSTVKEVLGAIDRAKHVQPIIYLDKELDSVNDKDAKGVEKFRGDLKKIVQKYTIKTEPHADIIKKLDESAKMYNVLILKTDLTLPYTSVFIELDCGYWDGAREEKLRDALEKE